MMCTLKDTQGEEEEEETTMVVAVCWAGRVPDVRLPSAAAAALPTAAP